MQTKTARFSIGDKIAFAGVVVAIVLPLVLYWISIKGKEISYEIVANTPLLSVKEIPDTRLQLSFDGQEVNDVSLVILKVINTGDEPIVVADYQRPMEFAFGSDADILSAEVLSTVPAGIPISITHSSETLSLLPTLLNEDDSIAVRVLASGPNTISASCRIAGVKECNLADLTKENGSLNIFIGGLLGAGFVFLYGLVAGMLYREMKIDILSPVLGILFWRGDDIAKLILKESDKAIISNTEKG
ncbi:hypothetical protein [Herpetosiphon giganteus]|uniref:hypothetical protein n=1 Tax=Herpetosiphon giganteus TaxID=2029754 RepID=UPI00195A769A|nr:hypothetical protein [Herpetosiphon giganteus]MBM7846284.1 hypothetical protein [Herpetosiphon giganteus]